MYWSKKNTHTHTHTLQMHLNDHFATVGPKLAVKISNRPYETLSTENMVEIGESG